MAIHNHRNGHETSLHDTLQQHDSVLVTTGLSTTRGLKQFLRFFFVVITLCVKDYFDFFFVFDVSRFVLKVGVDAFDADDGRTHQALRFVEGDGWTNGQKRRRLDSQTNKQKYRQAIKQNKQTNKQTDGQIVRQGQIKRLILAKQNTAVTYRSFVLFILFFFVFFLFFFFGKETKQSSFFLRTGLLFTIHRSLLRPSPRLFRS